MKCDICLLLTYVLRILCYLKENNEDKDDDDHDTGVQELKHYHWSYHGDSGPLHWYKNFFHCGGRRQSPINIITSEVEPVTWLNQFQFTGYEKISGQGRPAFMTLRNNGHTASMAIQDEIFIQGSNLRDRFQMAEIHFHWSEDIQHGSEHTLDGSQSPLEIHFVHFNTKYGNLSKAMLQPDGLAVIGVFAEVVAEDNLAFDHISQAVGKITHYGAKTKVTGIRPTDLLPGDTSKYFHYLGSLTTPPCYESVLWYVMAEKYRLSQRQINRFKRLRQHLHHVNSTGTPHSHTGSVQNHNPHGHSTHNAGSQHEKDKYILSNFRPTQPLNRRTVFCSHPSLRANQRSNPNNYQALHHPAANFRMGPQSVQQPAASNSLVQNSFGKRLNNNNRNRFLDMGATKTNSANGNKIDRFNKMEIRFGGDAGMKKQKIALGKPTSTTQKVMTKSTYPGLKTTQRSPLSLLDKVTNSYSLFSNKFLNGKFKIDKDALLKTFATLLIQQTKQLALSKQRKSFQNPTGIREFSNPLTGKTKIPIQQNQQSAALRNQNSIASVTPPITPNNNKILPLKHQTPIKSTQASMTSPGPITKTTPHKIVTMISTSTTKKPWIDPEIFQILPNAVINNSLPSSLPLVLVTQNQSLTPYLQQVQSSKAPPTQNLHQIQSTKMPPTPVYPQLHHVQSTKMPPTPLYPQLKPVQSTEMPPTPVYPHLHHVQSTEMPPTPAVYPHLHHVQSTKMPPTPVYPYLHHVQSTKMQPTPVFPHLQQVLSTKMPPTPLYPHLKQVQSTKMSPTQVYPHLHQAQSTKMTSTPINPYLQKDQYTNLPQTPVAPYVQHAKIPTTPIHPYFQKVQNTNMPSTPAEPYSQHVQNTNSPPISVEPFLQHIQNPNTASAQVKTSVQHVSNAKILPPPVEPYSHIPNAKVPPPPTQVELKFHIPNAKISPTPVAPNLHVPYTPTPIEPNLHVLNGKLPQPPVEPNLHIPNAKIPPTPVEPYLHVPNAKLATPVEPNLRVPNAKTPPTLVEPNFHIPNAKIPPTPVEQHLHIPSARLPPTPVEPYLHIPNENVPPTSVDPYLQHGQHANIPQTLFEPFLQEVQNSKMFEPIAVEQTTTKPLNSQDKSLLQTINDVIPKPGKNITLYPLHNGIQAPYENHVPKTETFPENGINRVTKADLQIITQAFESQHSDIRVPIIRQQDNPRWKKPKYVNEPFPSKVPSFQQNMQNEFNNFIENQSPNAVPTMEHPFTLPEKSAFRTNERPYRWEISTVPPRVRKWIEPEQSHSNPTAPPIPPSEAAQPSQPTAPPTPPPPRDYVMRHHLGFFNPMKSFGGTIISLPASPQTETTDQSWPRENSHRGGGSLSMMRPSDIFPDGAVPNHWPSDPRAARRQEQMDTKPDV